MSKKYDTCSFLCFFYVVLFFSSVVITAFISSCTQSPPECDDKKTVKAVISEASENLKGQLSSLITVQPGMELSDDEWRVFRAGMQFSLENIGQQGFDSQSGIFECTADLIINSSGLKESIPITYTAKLPQGSNRVQVTVSEL
jgi:hypothetical protein